MLALSRPATGRQALSPESIHPRMERKEGGDHHIDRIHRPPAHGGTPSSSAVQTCSAGFGGIAAVPGCILGSIGYLPRVPSSVQGPEAGLQLRAQSAPSVAAALTKHGVRKIGVQSG